MNNSEFQAHTAKIEELVQRVNELTDEGARTTSIELLQSLMDLHGSVMARIVEVLEESGDVGRNALAKLGSDPLVCGLMVLYGVHPVDLETRITRAVEKVQPRVRKQGGEVELTGISDGVVRVNIKSSGHGCGNSPDALKQLIEQAMLEAAPEVVEVMADGVPSATSGFVPLNTIQPVTKEDKTYEESAA